MWKNVIHNIEINENGEARNSKTLKMYKLSKNKKGYLVLRTSIGSRNNKKSFLVHRLVAIAFILNPNNYETVDHINKNKDDNRVDNLRWMSREENSIVNYWKGIVTGKQEANQGN